MGDDRVERVDPSSFDFLSVTKPQLQMKRKAYITLWIKAFLEPSNAKMK